MLLAWWLACPLSFQKVGAELGWAGLGWARLGWAGLDWVDVYFSLELT